MEKREKILYLDGLRGIAASAVVIVHFILAFYGALYYVAPQQVHTQDGKELIIAKTLWNIFYSANFAVPILFVLSAYVLSYRYFLTGDEALVRASAFRRYIRLAVPNLFSVMLGYIFLATGCIFSTEAAKITKSASWLGSFYIFDANFILAVKQGLWDGFFAYVPSESYNPAMWTMAYELAGSFIVFAFLLLFGKSKKRYMAYIALFFIFGKSHFSAFVFGLMLSDFHYTDSKAFIFIRKKLMESEIYSWIFFLIGLLLTGYFDDGRNTLSLFLQIDWLKYMGFDLWVFYHTAGAALLLLALLFNKKIQQILRLSPIQFLGKIAYSMYLSHVAVICSFSSYAFLLFFNNGYSYHSSAFFAIGFSIPVVLLIAYGMFRYIDDPAIRLSRFLQKKYFAD